MEQFNPSDWVWRPKKHTMLSFPAVENTMKQLLTPDGQILDDVQIDAVLSALHGIGMDRTPLSLGLVDATRKSTEEIACRIIRLICRQYPEEVETNGEFPLSPCGRNQNRFPLCVAVGKGLYDLTTELLKLGFNPSVKDCRQKTPLVYAIGNEDAKMSKLLLDSGADPFCGTLRMRTVPLCAVADIESDAKVRDFLNIVLDAKWTREPKWKTVLEDHLTYGMDSLIVAGRFRKAEYFLDAGANPVMLVVPREKSIHDEVLKRVSDRLVNQDESDALQQNDRSETPPILRVAWQSSVNSDALHLFERMMFVLPTFVLDNPRFQPIEDDFRSAMKAVSDSGQMEYGVFRVVFDYMHSLQDGETPDVMDIVKKLRQSHVREVCAVGKLLGLPDPSEQNISKDERKNRAIRILKEGWVNPIQEAYARAMPFDFER